MNFKVLAICTFGLAHAHIAMVQPKWNYGTADTSGCSAIYKRNAGKNVVLEGIKKTVGKLSADEKAFVECRWKANRAGMWFNHGTQIGCTTVTGQACSVAGTPGHEAPCCEHPMEPTITDPELLTFSWAAGKGEGANETLAAAGNARYNPWFAPGHAPVIDPCGVVGGYKWDNADLYFAGPDKFGSNESCKGCVVNGAPAPAGLQFKAGTYGSELFHKALTDPIAAAIDGEEQPIARWIGGGVAEVKYGKTYANHGGGYQWRLCPAEEFTADGVKNEECFQSMPLDYATGESWVEWNGDADNRTVFDAVRVTDANTQGVKPAGSTWTRFAVPNCGPGDSNNNCQKLDLNASKTKGGLTEFGEGVVDQNSLPSYLDHAAPPALNFPAKVQGVYGYGRADYSAKGNYLSNSQSSLETWAAIYKHYDYAVVDKVRVPTRHGRYVLSWRWDAEQTPQVWSNCALVDIVNESKNKNKTPSSRTGGAGAASSPEAKAMRTSLRGSY